MLKRAVHLIWDMTRSIFDRHNVVSDGDLREASNRLGHSFGYSTASVPVEPSGTRKILSNFDVVRWPRG